MIYLHKLLPFCAFDHLTDNIREMRSIMIILGQDQLTS